MTAEPETNGAERGNYKPSTSSYSFLSVVVVILAVPKLTNLPGEGVELRRK